jgi:succinoglycan biosynthesis protein ExoA
MIVPDGSTADPPAASRLPLVSIVVPIRNEEAHIGACLGSLVAQDYPADLMEIIVIDGCSEDRTVDVVDRFAARYPDARLRLLENPARTVPPGFNAGVRAALGDVIVRMDGHTVPAPDYVSRCVDALSRSGAGNVGGGIEPHGNTPFGHAVAAAIRHPLGAGDARFRVGGAEGDVDTVPFGAFRREVLERVGLLDESMARNEDYELNVRIRAAGERVYFDPAIRSRYTPRGSARALWDQYFQYGWWRVETWRRHPSSLRWRQALPPTFIATLVLLSLAAPWSSPATVCLVALVTSYALIVGLVSWRIARPPVSPASLAFAFAVLHVAFGSGFLTNVISGGRFPYGSGGSRTPPTPWWRRAARSGDRHDA